MMRKRLLGYSLIVSAMALLVSGAVLAADNWIGSWKLNAEKSKYSPGPGPKSLTVKFEQTPDGVKFSSEGVDADGKPSHSEFVSKFDGKEVPYTGNPNADMCSPKRINADSYNNPWKKDGKPTMTSHVVVSKDGKSLTVHQTGKNAKGEPVNTTVVFDKQ
jgi:hypothetical protein